MIRVHPLSAWRAVLLPVLCAGCDAPQQGQTPAVTVDRQAAGTENQVPALEGTPGTLRYRPGCLFLDTGGGGEIGLVVPADARFDGARLVGALPTPEGKPISREVGRPVSFTGRLIENPGGGRYGCRTGRLLITDRF